jgi:hypothetical protein
MGAKHLGNLIADSSQGIERRHRLLKDHADARPADLAHVSIAEPEKILALQQDLSGLCADPFGQ